MKYRLEKVKQIPRWRRRSILRFLPLGIGGLALRPGKPLFFKRKVSRHKAEHWETIEK